MAPPALVRRLRPGDAEGFRRLMAVFCEASEEPETHGDAPPDEACVASPLHEPRRFERRRREISIYDLAVAGRFAGAESPRG